MNPYTTMGEARIRQRDIATILRAHGFRAGAHLAAFERQRGWQVDAELAWQLQQNGVKPMSAAARISLLWQTIAAALIGVGERLSGTHGSGPALETGSAINPAI